jgi:hypothetical protein
MGVSVGGTGSGGGDLVFLQDNIPVHTRKSSRLEKMITALLIRLFVGDDAILYKAAATF